LKANNVPKFFIRIKEIFMGINEIFKDWKSPYITRGKLLEITGGIINPRTIRNLDSMGEGIKGKIRTGNRTVAYPVKEVIDWLNGRISRYDNGKVATFEQSEKNRTVKTASKMEEIMPILRKDSGTKLVELEEQYDGIDSI
jgi:hypothetical protein